MDSINSKAVVPFVPDKEYKIMPEEIITNTMQS
jgi:hypothetical protein